MATVAAKLCSAESPSGSLAVTVTDTAPSDTATTVTVSPSTAVVATPSSDVAAP